MAGSVQDPEHQTHVTEPAVEKNLGGHVMHEVTSPLRLYVPAGQVLQAVEIPSTKYCPATQHTLVPSGRHLFSV
jgi:hypothetical protein